MKHVRLYCLDSKNHEPVIEEIEQNARTHALKHEIAIIPGFSTYFLVSSENTEAIVKKHGGVLLHDDTLIRSAIMNHDFLFPIQYGNEVLRRLLDIQPLSES